MGIRYSFFVAGHVYGKPGVDNEGLHPPFEQSCKELVSQNDIEFGILTGDVVWQSTKENWDSVNDFLSEINTPVYIAVGNHDIADRELYQSRYGRTYFSFETKGDLFIVLDPNLDHWNISGDQLAFLKQTLSQRRPSDKNVFLFFHQVLWQSGGAPYDTVSVNSLEGKGKTVNFWSELVPLLTNLPNNVYCFAGDVGAIGQIPGYSNLKHRNISLIASGMGSGYDDNYLLVQVRNDNGVVINKLPLP